MPGLSSHNLVIANKAAMHHLSVIKEKKVNAFQ